ncbi:putative adenylyl-sulfate kinase [bioreactor metagenome]|uniref:Putative adenylyl-sulfate kinase n=2 Tax=root TaxID=1 RepID=A0A645HNI6_9ZZZZ
MAKLFLEAGVITLAAFISPFADDRQRVRALFSAGDFLEIYCNAPVDVCEARDVKGLYKKARQGLIPEFTGVSSAYQAPVAPELSIDTARQTVDQSVSTIFALLQRRGFGSG